MAGFGDLVSQGWIWAYLGVFAAGFFTSLTPCVYPMIPIVVGIFGARGEEVSRKRGFFLATMYVLGMGFMYSILGVAVALTGRAFGAVLANPWVVVPIVVFYAALAASMFGAFEMNLPAGLQARLSGVGGKGPSGAFGMGLVGGLTAAPCTGPMLAGILAWVATTKSVFLGFTALFTYALGMGILFWVIATFAVGLPKSGRWMEWVKSAAGIALLVVGVYFLRPVWPAIARLTNAHIGFLAGSIAIALLGLAMGALHLSFHGPSTTRLGKATGVALSVVGLVGVVNWTLTPRHPIAWEHDEQAALDRAKREKRPVVIDFGADWCLPCREYEIGVFADPSIHAAITDRFVPLKFDVSKATDADLDAQKRWNASSLPTVIVLDSTGKEVRRFGEPIATVSEFLKTLQTIE